MDKSLWLTLGISAYNWFAFITNQISWRKNPDSFGTPTIPVLGSILLALHLLCNLNQDSLNPFYLVLFCFLFTSELVFTFPFLFFLIQEAQESWKSIKVYPAQGKKPKKHDFEKNGAEVSMIGDFVHCSEDNKTWFELGNYQDKPTLRFPVLWQTPEVSSISKASVLFSEASKGEGAFIEVPEENIYQIRVWVKK